MILCADIVKESTDDYLRPNEQAFVTSWFRHIPESTLPTYAGVLLMANLADVPLGSFMLQMIVPMLVLGILGYFPYLHRLPRDPDTPRSKNRGRDALHLLQHLWTLLAILLLILIGKLSVVPAVAVVIAAAIFVYRFRPKELLPMLRSAFETKLLLNTFLVLVLKEFIAYTGVLETLPDTLSALPVPAYLIFALLFFVGALSAAQTGSLRLALRWRLPPFREERLSWYC